MSDGNSAQEHQEPAEEEPSGPSSTKVDKWLGDAALKGAVGLSAAAAVAGVSTSSDSPLPLIAVAAAALIGVAAEGVVGRRRRRSHRERSAQMVEDIWGDLAEQRGLQ